MLSDLREQDDAELLDEGQLAFTDNKVPAQGNPDATQPTAQELYSEFDEFSAEPNRVGFIFVLAAPEPTQPPVSLRVLGRHVFGVVKTRLKPNLNVSRFLLIRNHLLFPPLFI